MNCHGTCPSCQAEKALYANARFVTDHDGRERMLHPRAPTQDDGAAARAREARRAKAKAAKRARKVQRRRAR